MYKYSKKSMIHLSTVHGDLQDVFLEVIKHIDCKVLCGHRNKEEQNEAFENGFSTKTFPDSKHNKAPSRAVDVAPYPIDWKNTKRFYYFAGIVVGIAKSMGIDIRHGLDWDMDNNLDDQTFMDGCHFELVKPRSSVNKII